MLELIGQGLMAVVSGGATGILGVIAQRIFDHWKQKQELDKLQAQFAHERGMRELDLKLMQEEWNQRVKVAQTEAAGKEAVADANAFAASFNEPQSYSEHVKPGPVAGLFLVLLDFMRGIVRPGLTLYLCWIATMMYEQSRATLALIDPSQRPVEVLEIHQQIVLTLLYLFTTCVLWWFGTRNKQPAPKAAG